MSTLAVQLALFGKTNEESLRLLAWRALVSISIRVDRRHNRDSVGVRDTNNDGVSMRGEFSKHVVREQRQMGLARTVINHSEHAGFRIDVRRCARADGRGHEAVNENIVASADQAAERPA